MWLAPLLALGLSACTEQSFFVGEKVNAPGPEDAKISGRVCSPSGSMWLADAIVYTHLFTNSGYLYDTKQVYTDPDGYWIMEDLPPERDYTIYVQYGDEILDEIDVYLDDGETHKLEEPECFDPLQIDVAVIVGDYDDFQLVLGNMGFANYELVDGLNESELTTFLLDIDAMLEYDMIFFNGGHIEEEVIYEADGEDSPDEGDTASSSVEVDSTQIMENIKTYVSEGGTVYASDWAYDVVEIGWPDAIDFVGEDTDPDAAQLGEYDDLSADVADQTLAEWLDSQTMEIEYDLPVWPPIEEVSGYVTTHLTGDVSYREGQDTTELTDVPLLVSFSSGNGRVVFSTFRVAKNGTSDMMLALQYMMYSL